MRPHQDTGIDVNAKITNRVNCRDHGCADRNCMVHPEFDVGDERMNTNLPPKSRIEIKDM
jgi:hypothetical protein